MIIDSTGIAGAAFVAAALLDNFQMWNELLVSLLPVAIVFLLLVMSRLHLYDQLPYRRRYDLVCLGFSMPWLASVLASHYYKTLAGIDSLLLLGWSIGLPLVLVGRRIYDTFTDNWQHYRWAGTATLFVGDAQAEAQLKTAFPGVLLNWKIIGRISPASLSDPGAIGTIEDLPLLLERYSVHCIILAAFALNSQLFQTVMQHCDYADVKLLVLQPPLFAHKRLGIFSSAAWDKAPVLEVRESWSYTAQLVGKRVIDFVGAGLGLLFLSPLMLGIALLIRLDSEGPVFFRQQRLGHNGKPFIVWKFRTMEVDAEKRLKKLEQLNESEGGVLFKMKKDPRVTHIGKFLRRTSLDELPQLFNVLQGYMSLVGPRPLQLRDSALAIKANRDAFLQRLTVMPGMTGLWQVSGRSEVSFDDMLHLDIHYIEHWSLWLDLRIIWQTIQVVLISKGAY
jgi:exopolysaccharide biosynthesis polyprenyl glycosylphosphotransferase